jgi:hypothetical protein
MKEELKTIFITFITIICLIVSGWFASFLFTSLSDVPEVQAKLPMERLERLTDEDLVITSTTTPVQFTSATSPQAVAVWVAIQGGTVRFKIGSDPESNNGALLDDRDSVYFDEYDEVQNLRWILDSGSSAATAYVVFYKRP